MNKFSFLFFDNLFREEWEWLHSYSINNNNNNDNDNNNSNNNDEATKENISDDNGLSFFKIQFQEAAKDLCLMLSKLLNVESYSETF